MEFCGEVWSLKETEMKVEGRRRGKKYLCVFSFFLFLEEIREREVPKIEKKFVSPFLTHALAL